MLYCSVEKCCTYVLVAVNICVFFFFLFFFKNTGVIETHTHKRSHGGVIAKDRGGKCD